jgi:hypothetical protein
MRLSPLLGAIAIAITTTAIAQQPQPRRTGALAPGGTGLIAGRVTDPVSGRAVPDALVWLLIDGAMWPESPRVMTDAEGRFVFVNVPAGKYAFQAQKTGYLPGRYGAKSVMDEGRDLDLTDGHLVTDLTLPIWKYAAIGGTVTDEAGEPVVGVSVRAFRKLVTFGEVQYTPSFRGTVGMTDDRGTYRLAGLVPGEYIVAIPSTLATFPTEVMPSLLSGSEIQSDAFRVISELSPIGSPRNQQVGESVIMTGNSAIIPPAPQDDVVAAYRTTLFPAATKLADATSFTMRAGEERSGVDITMRPVRTARISGRVVSPEGPVGPTAVRLIPAGDALLSVGTGFDVATALSDSAGRFTLLGVPEGSYVAWVEKRLPAAAGEGPEQRPLLFASETITVGSAGTAELALTLRRAPRIAVRLDSRDVGAKPQMFEIWVEAVGPGGRAMFVPDQRGTAGAPMVPARYLITTYAGNGNQCMAITSDGRDVSDEPLVLQDDDVEVTISCSAPATRLSGTVRDERGSLDGDAVAVVFPADRRFWTGAGLRARRKAAAFTSASGSFEMVNLPPGEYLVAALPVGTSDFWQDPQVLDKLTPTATRVSLLAGESRTVDIRTVRLR